MQRIQFYPNKQLNDILQREAKRKKISVSELVKNLLYDYYQINNTTKISLQQTIIKVFKEIEEYVKEHKVGTQFIIAEASEEFRKIDMTTKGTPSLNRARIGKKFSYEIRKNNFSNVKIVRDKNGKAQKGDNDATVYEIV